MDNDIAVARRALALLDLTDLSEACREPAVDALCERAKAPPGPVAAVCLWPQWVSRARKRLGGSGVRIATVANFPSGNEDIERVIDAVAEALTDGADEIDLVIPYRALREGDTRSTGQLVAGVRDVVDRGRRLKVILETGELREASLIAEASRISIREGADFIKTSTGKTPVSATLEAAEVMLGAIREAGRPVGLKPSGGIRTLEDARAYLNLADRMMGLGWATPDTLRFGASGLYDALVKVIEGGDATPPPGTTASY